MREHLPTMTRALLRGTLAIAHLLIGLLMALVASVDPFDLLNRARLAGSWHRGLLRVIGVRVRRHGQPVASRSEEHTYELQALMRISYAVFYLKKKHNNNNKTR